MLARQPEKQQGEPCWAESAAACWDGSLAREQATQLPSSRELFWGGLVGSEIGKSLDRADRQYMEGAQQRAYAAPLNETISWSNP